MSTTQDTQTPQQPQWWEDRRREGYMIVREWRDEEGARHQELMSADFANAQQQRIQALEKSLDQTARESELHKLVARHWKGEARKLGSTKATWELDPDQPLEVRIEALEAALLKYEDAELRARTCCCYHIHMHGGADYGEEGQPCPRCEYHAARLFPSEAI